MRLNQKLSEKQLLIINFIENYNNENGISPTIEDVRVGCKLSSKSVVSYNLNILEEKGYLDRKKGMARSITSTKEIEKSNEIVNVPIVSNISAGSPLELFSSDEIFYNQKDNFESINISKSMLKNYNNIVALKISGDSMKGDLIMDGDIIILDCNNISTNDIKSGDIVVARVDEDYATLKRMFINKNKIELRPSNKLYSSIYTDKKNVKIDGKVVGLVRNY
ncbi:MAG: transcriptional repressor LexA [Chloroflexota bacterium]|nr:transcriptional repressor LexA [Chloroflexota bacterium]